MSNLPRAKTTEGKPYVGNQQFAGQGVKRSCDLCGKHVPIGQLRKIRAVLLACASCRATKETA